MLQLPAACCHHLHLPAATCTLLRLGGDAAKGGGGRLRLKKPACTTTRLPHLLHLCLPHLSWARCSLGGTEEGERFRPERGHLSPGLQNARKWGSGCQYWKEEAQLQKAVEGRHLTPACTLPCATNWAAACLRALLPACLT